MGTPNQQDPDELERLKEDLKTLLDEQSAAGGNSQCRSMLEGARISAEAGNTLGAARALTQYFRCLSRPKHVLRP